SVTTFTLVVKVNTGTTGSLTNTATVSSTTTDTNPANNSATAATAVSSQADLAVTKTAGTRAVFPGNLVVFSLGITNNGPSDAAAVSLSDPLPAHLTF